MAWKASVLAGLSLFLIRYFDAPVHGQSSPSLELVSIGMDGLAGNHHSGSDGLAASKPR